MKTEIESLRKQLGWLLCRGNGGGWESDFDAIKKAFPVWAGQAYPGAPIDERAAVAFAIWVLYAFHSSKAQADKERRPSDQDPGTEPILISSNGDGTLEYRTGDWSKQISGSERILLPPAGLPRLIRFDILRPESDLTILNNRKDETDPNNDVDAGPIGDAADAAAYAAAMPDLVLSDDQQAEIIYRMNSLLAQADKERKQKTNRFPGDPRPFPADVRERMKSDRLEAETNAGKRCKNCGDRNNKFPYPGGLTFMDKGGVFCSEKCGIEYPFPEASNAGNDVAGGELLGTYSIPKVPVQYFDQDGGPLPPDARFCQNCNRHFIGPAKIDARFSFCGEQCQNEYSFKARDQQPAVVARPPAIADPEETNKINAHRVEAAFNSRDLKPNLVSCGQCKRNVPAPDTFVVCPPRRVQPITFCGVGCLAKFLGLN